MLGGSQGLGGTSQRTGGLWPLTSAPVSPAGFMSDGYSKYGFYSLFAGAPTFGSTLYSHNTMGRFGPTLQAPGNGTAFHTTHKVSDSLFSATGYTFGAAVTPPPGGPYSPVPVAQLEFLTKGYTTTTNSNIIIQQQQQHQQSPICHPYDTPSCKKNVTISPTEKDKGLAFRQSQQSSTYKQQYIYQPEDGVLKLTALTASGDKGGVTGCSRASPLAWAPSPVHVKKEPTPMLLGDLGNGEAALIKMEMTSPVQKEAVVMQCPTVPSIVTANGTIPVGIAVGRQRIQHQEVAPSGNILTTTHFKEVARISEIADISAAAHHAAALQHHMPPHHHPPLHSATAADMLVSAGAAWGVMGGAAAAHPQHCHQQTAGPNGTQHTGTTLWTTQYSAPLPMEPLMPMSTVGLPLQFVREPTSGGFLLFPTAGIGGGYTEPVQQAAAIQLWPTAAATAATTTTTYPSGATAGHVILPPPPLPPPPPLQLLTSAHTHQHEGYHLSTMIATSANNNNNGNNGGLITTISDGNAHHHQQQRLHLVANSNNSMHGGATMFGAAIEQHSTGINSKLMTTRDCHSLTAPVKVEEGAMMHQIGTINALSTNNLHNEQVSPDSLQLFDSSSPVITTTTHLIYQPTSNPVTMTTQTATSPADLIQRSDSPWKQHTIHENTSAHRSQSTSPVTPQYGNTAQQSEPPLDGDVSMKQQTTTVMLVQDASNQTECTASDEESATLDSGGGKGDLLDGGDDVLGTSEVIQEVVGKTDEQTPDFSGLDLLSNSILQHETSKQLIEPIVSVTPVAEESLGGLELLCALAEQRLDEEVASRADSTRRCNNCNCTVDDEPYKSYKTKESEREVKRFIASKAPSLLEYKDDNGRMNDSERDMRQQLAALQRKYKEKQRELNKLKPHHANGKKHVDCAAHKSKKHRKKGVNRDDSPIFEQMDVTATMTQTDDITTITPQDTTVITTTTNELVEKRRCSTTSTTNGQKRRRKVGRPKKLEWSSDNESSSTNAPNTSTETIVAKKHKKNHHGSTTLHDTRYSDSPPRFTDTTHNKKIGPKLKAEARISVETPEEPPIATIEPDEENITSTTQPIDDSLDETQRVVAVVDTRCTLTRDLLAQDRLRVLTAMGGLFYAGVLNAVQPPDVYSITLDGERGNRPHIMSREEILRDAIVEVCTTSTDDLAPGTRLCAYWSQQYRCLYPGSVAELSTPQATPRETDKRFVAVEFDDGDNGTIAIEDIRLLPSDYPIIEYDPNPLLSLSKRKRRLSTAEERKLAATPPITCATVNTVEEQVDVERTDGESVRRHKEERKRLKKRKREKLREKQRCLVDGETKQQQKKKRKRKHKCLGEQCRHKRHHRKHKKHHRKRHQRPDTDNGRRADESVGEAPPEYPEYHIVPLESDGCSVTVDDVKGKSKRIRDRQESCESRSKMSAFLPPRQFWNWSGRGYKRPRGKGRSKKEFFKAIQRANEQMSVGDSAVFLSTGRPDRPYIGKIEAFWETCGTMVVKVKWFYHPEEANGCPDNLEYPGALFESPHVDENDVQTISHRCRVVPLSEYTATLGTDPTSYATIYDNNDIYYRAGYYDPTTSCLSMDKDIPLATDDG